MSQKIKLPSDVTLPPETCRQTWFNSHWQWIYL